MIEEDEKMDGGGWVNAILPRPPRRESKRRENAISSSNQQQVWVLKDGRPVAVPVTLGATDGVRTEILDGTIEPRMSLIVDVMTRGRRP